MVLWRDPSNSSPLALSEFETAKIIGVPKTVMIPARLLPYISILDVEQTALSAPEYTVPVSKEKGAYTSIVQHVLSESRSWRVSTLVLMRFIGA